MYDVGEKSEFNYSIEILRQIAYFDLAIAEARRLNNAYEWFKQLENLTMRVLMWFDAKEWDGLFNELTTLRNDIERSSRVNRGRNSISGELYDKLIRFQGKITGVLDKAGINKRVMTDASRSLR